MVDRGSYTRNEIFSQPEMWTTTLAQLNGLRGEIKAILEGGQFQSVVFTGCGSTYYLAQAAALGASLVVALNSDASVRRQGKGEDRPVNALEDRLAVMAALGCVSLVTWFEEDTPLQRILDCRPHRKAAG